MTTYLAPEHVLAIASALKETKTGLSGVGNGYKWKYKYTCAGEGCTAKVIRQGYRCPPCAKINEAASNAAYNQEHEKGQEHHDYPALPAQARAGQ